ncbi:MAG: response regulator [Myxococcales bacterium]|nr:response regulator [Myxococcales bacterium]
MEDDAVARAALCDLLAMDGFFALPSSSPEQALAMLELAKVDAVVTSLELPRSGGLKIVHAASTQGTTRVVVVTNHVGSPQARAALAGGARRVLGKPLRYEMLISELRAPDDVGRRCKPR